MFIPLDFQSSKKEWINSAPLSLNQLRGKIVLVQFFSYINEASIRTFPAMRRLWQRYSKWGVFVVGIHPNSFSFEKDNRIVSRAILRNGLSYPILMDINNINIQTFGATSLPAAWLIGPRGQVISTLIGPSGYDKIEESIVGELKKQDVKVEYKVDPELPQFSSLEVVPELPAGYGFGAIIGSKRKTTTPEGDEFVMPENIHKNILYPEGIWAEESEAIVLNSKNGSLTFLVYAREVSAILDSPSSLIVEQNGRAVADTEQGADVIFRDKKSYLFPHGPDRYNIIRSEHTKNHRIIIRGEGGWRVYAFICN